MKARKVNLSDLKGNLSKRGKPRYENNELRTLLAEMVKDGQPVVCDELFVVNAKTTEKEIRNAHARWRNRAESVFASLNSGHKISISWTDAHEMVIQLVKAEA